jgi:hypothetical protein
MKNRKSDAHRWAKQSSFLFMTVSAFLALNSPAWGQYSKNQFIENAISNNQLNQGLITTIVEIASNQFEIQKEEPCPNPLDSRIIVIYLDRTKQILTLEEALDLIQQPDWDAAKDTTLHTTSNNLLDRNYIFQKNYNHSVHSLGYVIVGGTIGYYLGKSKQLPPNPNVYNSPPRQYFLNQQNYPPNTRNTYNYRPHNDNKTNSNPDNRKVTITNNVNGNKVANTAKPNSNKATSSNKTANSSNSNKTASNTSQKKNNTPTQTHRSNHNSSDDDYSPANNDNDSDDYSRRNSVPDGRSGYLKNSSSSSHTSSSSHSG